MTLTIPTALTLFRIVLIPVMVVVFYAPIENARFWAALIFTVGALTDWLDGWIARRFNMFSSFGAFLDPVADKLAVAAALFIVVQAHPTVWLKTIVQMVAIVALLIGPSLWLGPHLPALPTLLLGEWLLAVAAALTLWSGADYLRAAWPSFSKDAR